MIRGVEASTHDDQAFVYFYFPSLKLATQMFRRAMEKLCFPANYQAHVSKVSSSQPQVTQYLMGMSDEERLLALHDRRTRLVTIEGQVDILQTAHDFTCVCTMHDSKMIWEPAEVELIVTNQDVARRQRVVFQPVRLSVGTRYELIVVADNEGPQMAKV